MNNTASLHELLQWTLFFLPGRGECFCKMFDLYHISDLYILCVLASLWLYFIYHQDTETRRVLSFLFMLFYLNYSLIFV